MEFQPNSGKRLEIQVGNEKWLRIPIKTRLITAKDNLIQLIVEYLLPHLKGGDMIFISEKVVCIMQGDRIIKTADVKVGGLARLLARQVRNGVGTPQFKGLGHGTGPAMQLLIDEAGVPRTLFATAVAAITRPLGIRGAFYYLVGKQAKSVDCPMSWTIPEYKDYAKRAPKDPDGVAREVQARTGAEAIIVDANYRGAFSLGKSWAVSEKFIRAVLADNPAGQDSEMTPFIIVRKAQR